MNANDLTMNLLRDGVPLSLLLDLAGVGVTSEELYLEESPQVSIRQLATAP